MLQVLWETETAHWNEHVWWGMIYFMNVLQEIISAAERNQDWQAK